MTNPSAILPLRPQLRHDQLVAVHAFEKGAAARNALSREADSS
jgi:hypothetical protein